MKLSYRDQVILIVVIILATLVAGFFLLIKPQMDELKMNEATLATKQAEKAKIEEKIKSVEQLREKVTLVYEENLELQEFFFPEMSTYEVDQFLYPFIHDNGIKIDKLDLTPSEAVALPEYVYDIEELDYVLQQYADTNNTAPVEENKMPVYVNPDQGEKLAVTTAKIEYHASMENLRKFLDGIENEKRACMITECSIEHDETLMEPNPVKGEILITFYSMDRVEKPLF